MAKTKPIKKKTRTRQHVIADLAVNHIERYIFQCGFSVERVQHDYGYDLIMSTYDKQGQIENDWVVIQVKATDKLKLLRDGKTVSFSLDRRDLKLWLKEYRPVILIVYDGMKDRAYWLYVQAYFEDKRPIDLFSAPGNISVRIPMANRVNKSAVHRFAKYRDNVLKQMKGRIRHHG